MPVPVARVGFLEKFIASKTLESDEDGKTQCVNILGFTFTIVRGLLAMRQVKGHCSQDDSGLIWMKDTGNVESGDTVSC